MTKKLLINKPIRYIVNLNLNGEDNENFVSYNSEVDRLNKSPYLSSYSFAILTASRYYGVVYAEYPTEDPEDPNRFKKVKDYSRQHG